MNKSAAPRWMKMLSGLSEAGKRTLAEGLPASQFRGSLLGRGVESTAYKGFAGGGVGEAVLKVDHPQKFLSRLYDAVSPFKQLRGRAKADYMAKHPDIFAKILGRHPKGYLQEYLKPVPWATGTMPALNGPLARTREMIRVLKETGGDLAGLQDDVSAQALRQPEYAGLLNRLAAKGTVGGMPSRGVLAVNSPRHIMPDAVVSDFGVVPTAKGPLAAKNMGMDAAGRLKIYDPQIHSFPKSLRF